LLKNGRLKGQLTGMINNTRVVKDLRIGLPSGSDGAISERPVLLDDYRASIP